MRRFCFPILLAATGLYCSAVHAQATKDADSLYGPWLQPSSNVWMFGLYPQFAMADGVCWSYKDVRRKKHRLLLVLQNGKQEKRMRIRLLRGGDRLVVYSGKGNGLTVSRKENPGPDFEHDDGSGFPEPLIHGDTVHLRGYIAHYDKGRDGYHYVEVIYNPLLDEDQRNHIAPLDTLGRFRIDFPLLNPQEVMLKFGNSLISFFGIPGDSLILSADAQNGDALHFGGKTGKLNTEIYSFERLRSRQFPYEVNGKMTDSLDPASFKRFRIKQMRAELDLLDDYVQRRHPGRAFVQQERAHIQYQAGNDLLRYRWLSPRFEDSLWLPNKDYLSFLDVIPLSDPLGMITDQYRAFLREYLRMKKQEYGLFEHATSIGLEEMLRQRKDSDRRIDPGSMSLLSRLALLQEGGDSVALARFMEEKNDSVQAVVNKYQKVLNGYVSQAFSAIQEKKTEHLKQALSAAGKGDIAMDILWGRLAIEDMRTGTALAPEGLSYYRKHIGDTGLYGAVRRRNELLQARLSRQTLQDINFLQPINKVQDSLFSRLMDPYKGKAVYVDFWGPWCGPCMAEMPSSKALEEKFEGKNVVFLYLCVSCTSKGWKNTVNALDLKGEHYMLSDDEFSLLGHKFQISGVPRYILVDRQGRVADADADRPSSGRSLTSRIQSLLKDR